MNKGKQVNVLWYAMSTPQLCKNLLYIHISFNLLRNESSDETFFAESKQVCTKYLYFFYDE